MVNVKDVINDFNLLFEATYHATLLQTQVLYIDFFYFNLLFEATYHATISSFFTNIWILGFDFNLLFEATYHATDFTMVVPFMLIVYFNLLFEATYHATGTLQPQPSDKRY